MGKNPEVWVRVRFGFSDDKGLVLVFYSPKLHPCVSVRLLSQWQNLSRVPTCTWISRQLITKSHKMLLVHPFKQKISWIDFTKYGIGFVSRT